MNYHTNIPANHFIPPADAPQWFLDNLHQAGESHHVMENGERIHYLTWNWQNKTLPPLILVHGFSGHAHWWSFLAPFFADRYRIAAIDLPGMGDSGYPASYHDECFANALLAMIQQNELSDVTLIGHSFGGIQSLRAMTMAPEYFRHGIVVDSVVFLPPQEPPRVIDPKGSHTLRPSREDCMARFRLTPPQPGGVEAVLQFIAFHSCKGDDERGWQWKFDPNIRNFGEMKDVTQLKNITAPVDCIYGELSMFNHNQLPQRLLNYFGNPGRTMIIPGAYHHLMVDHPLELVTAINQLLNRKQ